MSLARLRTWGVDSVHIDIIMPNVSWRTGATNYLVRRRVSHQDSSIEPNGFEGLPSIVATVWPGVNLIWTCKDFWLECGGITACFALILVFAWFVFVATCFWLWIFRLYAALGSSGLAALMVRRCNLFGTIRRGINNGGFNGFVVTVKHCIFRGRAAVATAFDSII